MVDHIDIGDVFTDRNDRLWTCFMVVGETMCLINTAGEIQHVHKGDATLKLFQRMHTYMWNESTPGIVQTSKGGLIVI